MTEIGMNRFGSKPTMCGSMNDRLRAVGDITCCKDSWCSCSQSLRVNQKTAPRSYSNARSFWQKGRIRRLTNCDKYDVNRDVEFGAEHRYRLAASLFIRFAQSHAL